MMEKWLYFMREMLINTVLFFCVWILMDVLFDDKVDVEDAVVRAVLFAIISVPIMHFMKKQDK